MTRLRTLILCSCVVLALGGRAVADGVIRDGLGAISCGRGGTNIAFSDNGVILLDNPAGMVNIDGCGLTDIGVDLVFCGMRYAEGRAPEVAVDGDPYPCGNLSLIRKSCDGCWAVGLGVYAPAAFGARYDLAGPPEFPGTRLYKSFGALGKVLPGVSRRLTDRLTVGGTLGVGVSHVELEGPYFLQSLPLQGLATMIDLQTTGAAMTWSLGLQYQLTPATAIGLAYQSESSFHLDGNIRVQTPVQGLDFTRYDADVNIMWPRSLGLGVRHQLGPCRILAADVIWFDWSTAFDQFDLHFSDPSNPAFELAGLATLDETLPLNWRDTVSVRVGYERHFGCGRVGRVGYTYHRNPIPAGTLTPYVQSILEHTFTAGYGWCCRDWHVDLAYQFTFGPEVSVARSDLFGGDFDDSRHEAAAHVLLMTLLKQF